MTTAKRIHSIETFIRLNAVVLCALLLTLASGTNPADASKEPIVVVPGLFSSAVEVKMIDGEDIPMFCSRDTDWEPMWLDTAGAVFRNMCWKYRMMLYTPGESVPFDGVQVRVPSDSIAATTCLDPSNSLYCRLTMQLGNFYDHMKQKGYQLGHDLDAVPYDWRLSPQSQYVTVDPKRVLPTESMVMSSGLFPRLKKRVEDMFNATGKRRVTLVGHSMGGSYTALFLNTYVNQAWKDTFVARFISVGAPYAGAISALETLLTGKTPYSIPHTREAFNTFAGLAMLVPFNAHGVSKWSDNATMVTVGTRKYTITELGTMLKDSGNGLTQLHWRLDTFRGVNMRTAPNVTVHCIIGKGQSTPVALTLSTFSDSDASHVNGDGDGTVPLVSAEVCSEWQSSQGPPVTTQHYTAENHALMAKNEEVWNYILRVVGH